MKKAEILFHVKVYRIAICGNHLHLLLRGKSRDDLQNFFRVFAGHIAQAILIRIPLSIKEKKSIDLAQKGAKKNRRRFWALLTYTRVISWGREFQRVANYIYKNILETLNIIAYEPRKRGGHRPRHNRRQPPE